MAESESYEYQVKSNMIKKLTELFQAGHSLLTSITVGNTVSRNLKKREKKERKRI